MRGPACFLLRKDRAAPGSPAGAVILVQRSPTDDAQLLRCAKCRRVVTSRDAAIEVDGGHVHVRRNPAGFVFQIGCFRAAPGCTAEEPSSEEWSWFPGYAWQVGLCVGCGAHLGWVFVLTPARFYGLILDRLVLDAGG